MCAIAGIVNWDDLETLKRMVRGQPIVVQAMSLSVPCIGCRMDCQRTAFFYTC
jgi:hypothetical protein